MRNAFALETGDAYQRKIWFQVHEVTDPGFYRALTSLNAFFHGTKIRSVTALRQFTYHRLNEVNFYAIIEGYTLPDVPNVGTIWDFYEFIGYDYKKKKYQNPNERILTFNYASGKFE